MIALDTVLVIVDYVRANLDGVVRAVRSLSVQMTVPIMVFVAMAHVPAHRGGREMTAQQEVLRRTSIARCIARAIAQIRVRVLTSSEA